MCDTGGVGAIERILVSGLNKKGEIKKKKKKVNVFTLLVYYFPFDSPYLVDKEEESFYPHYLLFVAKLLLKHTGNAFTISFTFSVTQGINI